MLKNAYPLELVIIFTNKLPVVPVFYYKFCARIMVINIFDNIIILIGNTE